MRAVQLLVKSLLVLSIIVLIASVVGFVFQAVHKPQPVSASTSNSAPAPGTPTSSGPVPPSVDDLSAYGEVPIPSTQTMHLPAGEVIVTFHAVTAGDIEGSLAIPDIKLAIDPPPGVAKPTATENIGGTTSIDNDAWRPIAVAQIPQEGDYQVITEGQVTAFVSAHLAFGHAHVSPPPGAPSTAGAPEPASPSDSASSANIYVNLSKYSRIAFMAALATLIGCVLATRMLGGSTGRVESTADLLASGQRVPGVVNSFRDTGRTARSSGMAVSRPELLDDPLYLFDVELQLPDGAPVRGRSVQRVPRAQVPSLAVGRQVMCAVDPVKPARRFVVDWGDASPASVSGQSASAAEAPVPAAEGISARLQELESLHASGAISDAEYAAKRQQVIADI
jgi:hypothetical protein